MGTSTGKYPSHKLNEGYVMMDGTSSAKSYMVFARRGSVALGVQAGGYSRNKVKSDVLMFAARLRADSVAEKLFADEDKTGTVVKLGDKNVTAKDAFDFQYDKIGDKTSSTWLTYYHKVDPEGGMQTVADAIRNGEIPRAIAKYLAGKAEGYLIISEAQITEWFTRHFSQLADDIEMHLLREKVANEVLDEHIGTVATGVEFRAKIEAKLPQPKVEDADQTEDEDEDE